MTRPIIITGAGGFVGTHLHAELGEDACAIDVDVTDSEAVSAAVRELRPGAVVHLAATSSVSLSFRQPAETWRVNAVGTVNVLEAVRRQARTARVLVLSTGEVYGRAAVVPTPEDSPFAPLSPYAASKVAAEVACVQAARADGLDVVVARSFGLLGPGQSEKYFSGSWTRQIAQLEHAGGGVLFTGDLSIRRDLTDVRDACRAFRLLLDRAVPAGTYNVASGRAVALSRVVRLLLSLAQCAVEVRTDPERLRPADVPVQCGDPSRLQAATGWTREVALRKTLADALDAARASVHRERLGAA